MATDRMVISADGTPIHFLQEGQGPGLLLIHGGLQTAGAFKCLAEYLSGSFTIYRVNRRGRRPSGGYGDDYCMAREIEDVRAIVAATGARNVFGLSVGALVTLYAAREIPSLDKIALYEPPLEIAGEKLSPLAAVPIYEKAMSDGDKARALVAILQGIDDPGWMTRMPAFLLAALFRFVMNSNPPGSEIPMNELVPTVHYDMLLAREMGRDDHGVSRSEGRRPLA